MKISTQNDMNDTGARASTRGSVCLCRVEETRAKNNERREEIRVSSRVKQKRKEGTIPWKESFPGRKARRNVSICLRARCGLAQERQKSGSTPYSAGSWRVFNFSRISLSGTPGWRYRFASASLSSASPVSTDSTDR